MKYLTRIIILFFVVGVMATCKKENQAPTIQSTTANPQTIKTGETAQLTCVATDPDGDQLIYSWSSSKGTFPNGTTGSSVFWEASDETGSISINVTVNDGENIANSSVNITVEANPQLSVTPNELDFGTEDTEKTIEIENSGTGTLTWNISESIDWLTLSTSSGNTTTETDQITATIDRNGLDLGSYNGTITITSDVGNQDITVTMELEMGIFTDSRDEITYNCVKIGEQIWMAENLAYIPSVSPSLPESYTEPYYYVYDYNGTDVSAAKATDNYATFGVLYNWIAAITACPDGWHLPSHDEWTELTDYLGGESIAGDNLKEAGTTHWRSPNAGATNEAGFSGLPGGGRYSYDISFTNLGYIGFWWSSTEYNSGSGSAWVRTLSYLSSNVNRDSPNKELGFSVRCVKDE